MKKNRCLSPMEHEVDKTSSGSVTLHKHYVNAGGQAIALVTLSGTTWTTKYLHRDNLGSTTAITDASGSVIERLGYDSWGKRRNANGVTDPNDTLAGQNTDRGYTNAEHIESLALINMNGRVYDPALGRFMGADPYIQSPSGLQSYNRYSYVNNNPLIYTDPTGYLKLKNLVKAVAAVVAVVYLGPMVYENAFWWAIGNGVETAAGITAIAGAASGAAVGEQLVPCMEEVLKVQSTVL